MNIKGTDVYFSVDTVCNNDLLEEKLLDTVDDVFEEIKRRKSTLKDNERLCISVGRVNPISNEFVADSFFENVESEELSEKYKEYVIDAAKDVVQ